MSKPAEAPKRVKVLFVCVGNSCRSQMAEAIARHYAPHIIEAESAGISPLGRVALETLAVLQEKGIRAEGHYSKSMSDVLEFFEPQVVVNMSGHKLNGWFARESVLEWEIEDPYGSELGIYRRIYGNIEEKVKKLARDLRKGKMK
jgi:arsenate reductase (thioredoxin)